MAADSALRVDIGIVTYESRDMTLATVRAVLAATCDIDSKVLIHDNGSTDGTVELLREHCPEVDVNRSSDNRGFAAGMNLLLRRSDAPWFFACNSDAWPADAQTLPQLHATALAHPTAAVVAPVLRRPDGGIEHSVHPFPSVRIALAGALRYGYGRFGRTWGRSHLLPGAWAHDELRPVDWAVGAAWLMRRAAVEDVGGFDETFFMYAEDLEWCWRARRHGWDIWFDPAAEMIHIGEASGSKAYGDARAAAWVGNSYRFYRANHSAPSTAAYQALNSVGAARAAITARRSGREGAASYWWGVARHHLRPASGTDRPGRA